MLLGRRLPHLALIVGLLVLAPAARADDDTVPAPAPPVAKPEPKAPAVKDPLVIATHERGAVEVVDGDTLRVKGQPSVRVLFVDTEELFREAKHREAAEKDFAAYAKAMRGEHARPQKYGTPAGEAAKVFVSELLADATAVRLERDELKAPAQDIYGRTLAHVVIVKPAGEVNLAVALVKAGHSPYFVKYGNSLRFDKAFRDAEKTAQAKPCGVWAKEAPAHYPDYAERLVWWRSREQQVNAWRLLQDKPDHVTLSTPQTAAKLKPLVGKTAVVRGLLSRIQETKDKSRMIVFLSDTRRRGFPLVFFDKAEYAKLDLPALESRYITVRGEVSLYRGRPQMVVERADQISTR